MHLFWSRIIKTKLGINRYQQVPVNPYFCRNHTQTEKSWIFLTKSNQTEVP